MAIAGTVGAFLMLRMRLSTELPCPTAPCLRQTSFQFAFVPLPTDTQVFTEEELAFVAELCIKHDVIAVCDEASATWVWGAKSDSDRGASCARRHRSV